MFRNNSLPSACIGFLAALIIVALQATSAAIAQEPPAWQIRADSLKEEGKYEDAIDVYQEVLKKEPKNYDALCARALAWLELGDTEKSIEDYSTAINLSPERHEAYTNRAFVYEALGEFDKAIADANKAVSIAPKKLDALYALSSTYQSAGKQQEALKVLNTAVNEEGSASAAYYRGTYWNGLREYEKAIADFTLAIQRDKKDPSGYYARGLAYNTTKRPDLAIPDFTAVIGLAPETADAYYQRGYGYYLLKKNDQALPDLNKAVEIDPENSMIYYVRSIVHRQSGSLDLQIKDLDMAIELDPENVAAFKSRAVYYFMQKDFEKSRDDGNQVLSVLPNESGILTIHSRSLSYLGEFDAAFVSLKQKNMLNLRDSDPISDQALIFIAQRNPEAGTIFQKLLKASHYQGPGAAYLVFGAFLSAKLQGDQETAKKSLEEATEKLTEKSWPTGGLAYFQGKMTEEEFLNLAQQDKTIQFALTDAHALVGMNALIEGRSEQAKKHFEWVAKNGHYDAKFGPLAYAELRRLNNTTKAP